MRLSWIFYFLGSTCLGLALAGKVLVVLPLPLYSHTMPFMPLFKALADKGHELTFISPLSKKLAVPNFKNIDITLSKDKLAAAFGTVQNKDIQGFWYEFFGSWRLCPQMIDLCLSEVTNVLPPPSEKFDLVIVEAFFCQQPLIGIGHYYGAPVVVTHPGPMTPTVAYHTGNPTLPSYVPNIRTPLTDHMDFWGRMKNAAMTALELLLNKFHALKQYDTAMRQWLKIPNLPYIEKLLNNVSLVLIDTHFSLNYARPYARNILEVGGLSVKVADPLPPDLEKFISEAEHGVIFFCLGSNIDGSRLQPEFLLSVMESFKYVKQRVLFKMDKFEFPHVPENVLVKPWFPQPSILNHKNVVLFINHGGLNSIHEAAYFGVPVLGLPFFVDQPHNILLLQEVGLGYYLDPNEVTDASVMMSAMKKVLDNPRETAKKRKQIVRDHPIPVINETVYWVEYVMKYGGAPHLRPGAVDMPWYQLLLLDVVGFVSSIVLIVTVLLCYIIKMCCRKRPPPPHKLSKKKQQ